MSLSKPEPLCRYRYDPLDRLASCLPLGQDDTRCFYRLNSLTTEIQGQIGTSWLQTDDRLLAQYQQDAGNNERVLIATDTPGSVSHALGADQPHAFGYTPYGTRAPAQAPLHLPGFNGERRDPATGHYLLGNGYRAFNPVLMRFNSPDNLSPFGEGGLNAYAYCVGDPVNRVDSTGHIWDWAKAILRPVGLIRTRSQIQLSFDLRNASFSTGSLSSMNTVSTRASMTSTESLISIPKAAGTSKTQQTATQLPAYSNLASQSRTGRILSNEKIDLSKLIYAQEQTKTEFQQARRIIRLYKESNRKIDQMLYMRYWQAKNSFNEASAAVSNAQSMHAIRNGGRKN
ncbi:hypothetical protein PS3A_39530 [Pseudomonas sp. 3A(2025)]